MRKRFFSPQVAAAAVIFTVLMFANIFVEAQDITNEPCPPQNDNRPIPIEQHIVKKIPGTSGGLMVCTPTINVNAEPENNPHEAIPMSYKPIQNDGFANSPWMVWILLVTFALGGIIFWLIANTGKEKRGNPIHSYHYYHHYPDVTIKIISFDAPKPKKGEDK